MLFLHYPPCTTCRKAAAWLEANGLSCKPRHIKEENPSYEELKRWYEVSGLPLKRFFNTHPFILGNRDRVTLSPITGKLKKNDLPFYRRANGQFVLHRIVKVEKDGTYTCCGDHQWWLEKGLKHDQMIGVATEYVRKGKRLTNKNIIYRIYRTVWTWLLRYRKYFFALYSKAVTLFRRNKAS